MVVSVVRGSLCDTHDIQDAVQATFLILVKSALKIQQRQSLAAWLHGVAYRTARRIHDRASSEIVRHKTRRFMPMNLSLPRNHRWNS
ncbi:MAG: sigma factor [Pirellulaceae bacterium]